MRAAPEFDASAGPALQASAETQRTADAVSPFEQALKQHFPSREAVLAEARAQTARQRRHRARLTTLASTGLVVVALAATWTMDPTWQTQELQTAIGQRSNATLTDGSTVQLNTDTVLRVQSKLHSRQITLVRGEASFSVAHGWRPFVVHAPGVIIRDIGTVFNVRQQRQGVQVVVIEGAVEVVSTRNAPANSANAPQRVDAGQAWTMASATTAAAPAAAGTVTRIDAERATAWQHDKLVFDGTPLAEVLSEVQRYRRAPLRVLDEQAARMRVSGEYDTAGIEALIDALPATLPVRLERAADGSVGVSSRR